MQDYLTNEIAIGDFVLFSKSGFLTLAIVGEEIISPEGTQKRVKVYHMHVRRRWEQPGGYHISSYMASEKVRLEAVVKVTFPMDLKVSMLQPWYIQSAENRVLREEIENTTVERLNIKRNEIITNLLKKANEQPEKTDKVSV